MLDRRLETEARLFGVGPAARAGDVGWPVFAAIFAGCFLVAALMNELRTVHHDVTEIAMWSGTGWQLGFWKHPPLLPWLFRAAFAVLGESRLTISALTALNVTIGAWAVWRISCLCLDEQRAARSLGLYTLSPLVTVLALKLNHNAILVSLWPLTVLTFLRMMRDPTVPNGLLLGLMAALSMLAKYYSALLLVSCAVALLASPDRRRVLLSPAPWVAGLAGLAIWSPNLWWITHHDLQPIQYAMTSEKTGPWRFLAFAGGALGLISPMLVAALWQANRTGASLGPPIAMRAHLREIAIIAAMPFLLTMVLTYALALRGATMWALPIFSLVPILIAAGLPAPRPRRIAATIRRLPLLVAALLPVTIAVEMVSVRYGATTGEPRAEIVATAAQLWRDTLGSRPIAYAAGDTRLVSEAALSLRDHPLGWPRFDYGQAEWMTTADTGGQGLLVLCGAQDKHCLGEGEAMRLVQGGFGCAITTQKDFGIVRGPAAAAVVMVIAPAGATIEATAAQAACERAGGSTTMEIGSD